MAAPTPSPDWVWRLALAPRAPGLTVLDAQRHWATGHRDLALELPMVGYLQHHAVLDDGTPLLPYPGFDICPFTAWESLESMRGAFVTDHYRDKVQADERELLDKARLTCTLAQRVAPIEGDVAEGGATVLSYMVVHPMAKREQLIERLTGEWISIAASTGPLAHEQYITRPDWHQDEPGPAFDAVDVLSYPSVEAARAAVYGPLSQDGGLLLAGYAFGIERMIARSTRMR
jgi:hypothetical protein